MTDEAKGEVQIYEFFSECLKIFRKKIVLLCKITQSADNEQANQHYQSRLNEVIKQAKLLLTAFQQIQQKQRNIKSIFSRFLLRIRQSIHGFTLKTSSQEIVNFLKFLQKIIKEFNFDQKLEGLLIIILLKLPKKFIKESQQNGHKIQSQKNISQQNNISGQNGNKISKHFDSYDRYIEALEKQYRLFQCLNIEELHMRKTFFLALEDIRRKDNNLLQDMMSRNRFAKQTLDSYQKSYQSSKKRILDKKQKLGRTQGNFIISQVKSRSTNEHILDSIKDKQIKHQTPNHKTVPKRLRTQHLNQRPNFRQGPLGIATLSSFKNNFNSQEFQNNKFCSNKPLKTSNQSKFRSQQFLIKTKVFDSERQRPRNTQFIPLKKIQFLGSKIQLVYHEKQKKQKPTEQNKKKLYNRAQEHVRKKISFITQAQVQKLIPFRAEGTFSPQKNNSNFNSIRINHFKIESD